MGQSGERKNILSLNVSNAKVVYISLLSLDHAGFSHGFQLKQATWCPARFLERNTCTALQPGLKQLQLFITAVLGELVFGRSNAS